MMFPQPSPFHRLVLKLLKMQIVLRDFSIRAADTIQNHSTAILAGIITGVSSTMLIVYRHQVVGFISVNSSSIATAILNVANAHPRFLRFLHVSLNAIPDFTFFFVTFAGVSYLMPKLTKRIEASRALRWGVGMTFLIFGILAVFINAINREEQDSKEKEHEHMEQQHSDRVYQVQSSLSKLQTTLLESRGKTSEIERRKGILDSLRAEYVLSHKDAPVSMITGDSYPSRDWMVSRLKQMGETWPYVPPVPQQAIAPQPPPAPPPSLEVMIAVGNDDLQNVNFTTNKNDLKNEFWIDQERKCVKPFKCYPQRDLDSQPIELSLGSKGWARLFITVYDTGGSPIVHPYVGVNLANGHGVAINRIGDHHPLDAATRTPPLLEFKSPEYIGQILPFKITHSGYDYPIDLVVDRVVSKFLLGIRIYGDNFEAKTILAQVKVID